MAAVLNIDPTTIRVVGIQKGSVIVKFDVESPTQNQTESAISQAQTELTKIKSQL
jgi:uncharacterized membrane-anchored protein YhcB (DUF1043 family)